MKILWASPNLLHPTTKGGQIRTLEMLRILHLRHEIHYLTHVDENDPATPAAIASASEYCSRLHTLPRRLISKRSPLFAWQLLGGLVHPMPVTVRRYYAPPMRGLTGQLLAEGAYDRAVCDFLAPAAHFPDLGRALFFPHNVETLIWERHAETAPDPLRRAYFRQQAAKMRSYEGDVCRRSGHIVAVSEKEAQLFQSMFGARRAAAIPTGVNLDYFSPPDPLPASLPRHDLVFIGSMDYLPNIEGVNWFLRDILPLIRATRPATTAAIVGRSPSPELRQLAGSSGGVTVTGTVPDVRPYLWGSRLSIVPLRIGGGTRLKVYESMAARVPVLSTSIGAEGLQINPPRDILIADTAGAFAAEAARLLDDPDALAGVGSAAWSLVESRFTWPRIVDRFEQILDESPCAR